MSEEQVQQIRLEAEQFMKNDYGQFVMGLLTSTLEGYMASARDVNNPNRIHFLDKAIGIEEAIQTLRSPLDT